jgi:hypothetical protein
LALSIAKLGKLLENWDKHVDTDTLDEFRSHLETSLKRRQRSLQEQYDELADDQFHDAQDMDGYKSHLAEQMSDAAEVQKLADELTIIALYKQIELHSKRVAIKNFPDLNVKQLFNIATMKKVLPFDIEALPNFAALDELRLLNNAIKHEGKVSWELAQKFPFWVQGEELKELGKAYSRLLPMSKDYVRAFVSSAYANTHKFRV